jgi:hypothetical protein
VNGEQRQSNISFSSTFSQSNWKRFHFSSESPV